MALMSPILVEHAGLPRGAAGSFAGHSPCLPARRHNRADGAGLPGFLAREFREFLTCGVLAHGFVRVRCERCAFEQLLPFSCKGRGFCPSCGGRRMAERAAHLVDEVVPPVPVRQWVLTLPYRLRYFLAWDHGLSRAVLAIHPQALLDFYRREAHRQGRTGTVTAVQRFGGGLKLNVHFQVIEDK